MRRAVFAAVFIFLCAGCLAPAALLSQESLRYREILAAVEHKDIDGAFVLMYSFRNSYPASRFTEKILFSLGEYYFRQGNYYDARAVFTQFLKTYPGSRAELFAMAYMLEIAKIRGTAQEVEDFSRDIVTFMKVSLLFREYKTYEFVSFLRKKYKAVYFIDKVEFYIDDELFTSLAY